MERVCLTGLLFLCCGLNYARTQTLEFTLPGGSVELRPPPDATTADITGIQWRHNEDIVAEWTSGVPGVDIYNNFKDRTHLDTASGFLTVRNVTKDEAGAYTVEINSVRLDHKYEVKLLKKVPKPDVWPKPSEVENQQYLFCEGVVTGAEPVTYWWNLGENRAWVEFGQKIVIQNNDTTKQIETFSCKIKNPVSEAESEPKANPFFHKPTNLSGLLALLILPILAGVGGVVYCKREWIREHVCANNERNKVDSANAPPEETPLKNVDNGPAPKPAPTPAE